MEGLYYKPLMTTFFSLVYSIFGPNPFFFHLMQLSFHIASSILVFLIFKHFYKDKTWLSFTLAVIFLIHPINTEAVVYISDLQDILYFFFGILSLCLIIAKPLTFYRSLVISLLLLSSLLSKETGVVFIGIISLFILLYRRKDLLFYGFALGSALGIYSFLRFVVAGIFFNKHGLSPITVMNFGERLMSIPKIIMTYITNFVFPQNLAINQHWAVRSLTFQEFYLPLIIEITLLVFATVLGFVLYRKNRKTFLIYLFFFLWFAGSLGLHLQIFPLDLTVSDRWFYTPIVGFLGMIGVISSEVKIQKSSLKKFITLTTIIIIILLLIRTFIRNTNWRDGLRLYGHDIQVSQGSFDLENNYGVELFRAGKVDEAKVHFEKSTQLAPKWWTNWNNLGVMEERKGDYEKAGEYYKKAIDNGNYYLAYENYAGILLFHKDPKEAKEFIEESLKYLPYNSKLWFFLALSEYKLDNKQNALEAAKNAYQLSTNQQTYYIYSRLLQNQPLEF